MNTKPLNDEAKARLYERLGQPGFLDRCHRYGWAITLIGTFVFQIVMWASTVGAFKQSVEDMKQEFSQRIERLERQVDKLLEKR